MDRLPEGDLTQSLKAEIVVDFKAQRISLHSSNKRIPLELEKKISTEARNATEGKDMVWRDHAKSTTLVNCTMMTLGKQEQSSLSFFLPCTLFTRHNTISEDMLHQDLYQSFAYSTMLYSVIMQIYMTAKRQRKQGIMCSKIWYHENSPLSTSFRALSKSQYSLEPVH